MHWASINIGVSSTTVSCLTFDPANPQTLYMRTDKIYKSVDGGNQWSAIQSDLKNFGTLTISPANPQTIYAISNAGIHKSLNGGEHWERIKTGVGSYSINTISFDPVAPHLLYAGTNQAGLFKSTDSGRNWTDANSGLNDLNVNCLAIDHKETQNLYVGTNRGVSKSIDGGKSWMGVTGATPYLSSAWVRALAIDPGSRQTIYAGTDRHGIFRSLDGGWLWHEVNQGLTNGAIYAIAIDPVDRQTVYAGSIGGGVYKSTNWGGNWTQINRGLGNTNVLSLLIDPSNPQRIYAGTWQGLYKSDDGGTNWGASGTAISGTAIDYLQFDPQDTNKIYAGGRFGIFKSADRGSEWVNMSIGLPINDYGSIAIRGIAIDPAEPNALHVATDTNRILAYLEKRCSGLRLSVHARGVESCKTPGIDRITKTGYGNLTVNYGAAPYATGVFSLQQNGVTITEAGIPVSPPTMHAQVFIDYRTNVIPIPARSSSGTIDANTGIAIVNPGSATAAITYTLRNLEGVALVISHGTLAAGEHFAKFIDQLAEISPDFNMPSGFQMGSLEISSDQPISNLTLMGTMNQRNEFLITTIPVADLAQSAADTPLYFPQLADGGGSTTSLLLFNTSDEIESGTLHIFGKDGNPMTVNQAGGIGASSFRYSIPPKGSYWFQTDGHPEITQSGWMKVIPDPLSQTPVGAGIFYYNPRDILISESGIPASTHTLRARVYVDLSQNHNVGLAIANTGSQICYFTITAFKPDGSMQTIDNWGAFKLTPGAQDARFADQLLPSLPAGFKGTLEIKTAASTSPPFAALTLRSLMNERNEFLMTAFPVADVTKLAPTPAIFPQIADGGGNKTEFIFIGPDDYSETTLQLFDENGMPTEFSH